MKMKIISGAVIRFYFEDVIFFKVKISYLDGKPVTDGNVNVEISIRNFNKGGLGTFKKTFLVKNGIVNVVLETLSPYAKKLTFKVTL